ncbi:hypothetical protein JAAARDRAFT_400808 [Jaapia argillacea MUCL 33604]|uniref:RRM domain-containing protein n=1 Tax=Jaapia argillacea MUCL 33604 TaxID=933084 RepID=A0A067PIA6_9AGAM|nr:hypothetical protein JAAARDRAFT_400808 [Jaapia argillacea MUCL 33604]
MLRLCLRSQVRAGLASAFNFRALSTSVLRPIPLVRPQQGSLLASSFLRNTNFSTFSGLRYEAVPSPSEARSVEGESAEEPEPVVPSSRLYIGNLPFDLAEKALYDFVRPFGQIADITMRRGYALVEFTSLSSSTAFYQKVQQSPPVVGSRTLKVEFASGDGKRTFSRPSIEPHETVYLAGFDSSVTEQDLAEFAQGYGEVRSIRFVPGAKFAHIHFETLDAAEACVDAASGGSQSRSLGPRLSVEFSAKKSPRGRRETEPRAEPSTKVFVGNLHEIEKEEFEEYLTSYGPESVFMKLEKGFAILDFPTIEAATHFVSQSHQIGPQRLRVNFSTTSLDSPSATRGRDNSSRRTQQGGPKKGNQKAADRPENPPNTRVFVANCPLNAPEEMIRELAEPFGKSLPFHIPCLPTGLDKGFAFLHFATLEEATAFVTECKQNAPTWEGRSLHVQFAVDNHQAGGGTPREPQPKVFIGGMHGVTQEQLTEYLKLYGPLENLWIHQERGFGLVDFPTTEAAQSFVSASPHIIGSTTLRVNFSERTTEDPGYQLSRGPIKDPKPPSSTVLIGNLAKDVTVDDLNAVVEPFGPIMSINIPRKPDGASKGAALVMFDSIEKATAFIAHVAENITLVNGRTVRAEFGKESTKIPRKISTHTPSKTVFIGNVPYDATEEDLRSITEPFGNVQGVKIGRNGQGAATGYALIHFEELDSSISFVQDAISRPPRIRDRHVRADFSNLAFMDFGGTAAKASFTGTVYKPTKTVWIGNDLESVREEEVRELCEQFGELTAIRAGTFFIPPLILHMMLIWDFLSYDRIRPPRRAPRVLPR